MAKGGRKEDGRIIRKIKKTGLVLRLHVERKEKKRSQG